MFTLLAGIPNLMEFQAKAITINIAGVVVIFRKLFVPNATLAEVASWFIQKETHDNITISMEGR